MDKKIKAAWIKALRSGEYKQTQGNLISRVEKSFCCLGVLCDVTASVDWELYRKDRQEAGIPLVGFIPTMLLEKAELSVDEQWKLVSLDAKKASFSEIADYIEANL